MNLDVNTGALVKYTEKLDRMQKNLLPKAVRNTLNDIAFQTKKRVPLVASGNFIIRNKSLFRTMILVNKVSSTNINSMSSEVGIFSRKDKIAEGLEKQEVGGTAERTLIQLDTARISSSLDKKVRTSNYLNKISFPKNKRKGSGTGIVVIQKNGRGTVFQSKKGRRKQKLIPIYSMVKNRRIQVKRKPFIRTAAEIESRKIDLLFVKNAEYLISKIK